MKKLKIILFIVFCILYVSYYLINSFYVKNEIEAELNKSIKDLKLHYEITRYHNKKSSDALYYSIIQNKQVIDILKKSVFSSKEEKEILREKLYKIIKPTFLSMKNSGLKILQFSTPDNKSFLRAHKKGSHSDDLSSVRPSITIVNNEKALIYGFEQGKFSHAFRHVYPIFDKNNQYLGAVDFGFSSESVQKTLEDVNKIHSHFLVNKKILEKRILNQNTKYYKPSIEHTDYLIAEIKEVNHIKQEISKWTIHSNKELINRKFEEGVEFSIYGQKNDDLIVISFIPIRSIKEQKDVAAYIVSYTSNNQIINILKINSLINLLFFIILVTVLYFIYKQIVHKKELHAEVKEKTKKLKILNENLEEEIELETIKNRQKDKQLHESTKKAQMGEMLGNIAHQWRQPLSVISTISSGLKINIEFDMFNKQNALKDLDKLNKTAQHLSETIDIFRDYIKTEKELKIVSLQERVNYSLSLIDSTLESNHIKIIKDFQVQEDVEIELLVGELSQVIINILNNAKDALVEREIKDRWIKIIVKKDEEMGIVTIEDNAKGISKELLLKVFDPYFTTKHQSQGTGIGLYMSLQIIEKHLGGKLYVKNSENGAKFYIELPLYKRS